MQYTYDRFGRVVKAQYGSGYTIDYSYDYAGNRTQVVQSGASASQPPAGGTALQLSGPGPVNLRSVANAAGYGGQASASYVFEVANGVSITGAAGGVSGAGGIAIDTGTWPAGVSLTLVVKTGGIVRGGGGGGGYGGGTSPVYPGPGGAGGDAVYCRTPLTVTVESGALLQGGGGGGGGGGRATFTGGYGSGTFTGVVGASGGGGGAPNGAGGTGGLGSNGGGNGAPGYPGTTSGGGAGGNTGPPGGAGASYAATGAAGLNAGAAGGAGGYAVRMNGHAVAVGNSGTITGTQG